MALAYEDSRMSMDSDLSNMSPCKPATSDNKTTAATKTTTTNNISFLLLSTKKDHCFPDEETEASPTSEGSTTKDSHRTSKPEVTPKGTPKVHSTSWADIVEGDKNTSLNLGNKEGALEECKTISELAASDSKMSMDEGSNSSIRSSGSGRQIEIDILDSANVEKYEKLVRDDKIKSPFKRRLSGGADDDESCDGHAKFDDAEASADGISQHKKSKTGEDDHGRERFRRDSTSSSGDGSSSSQSSRKPIEYEGDLATLVRRQKQIDYGKNTLCYENYLKQVPKEKRTKDHPKTPPKHIKYSRRAWDGVVKVWRKQLHCFDPSGPAKAGCTKESSKELKADDSKSSPSIDTKLPYYQST